MPETTIILDDIEWKEDDLMVGGWSARDGDVTVDPVGDDWNWTVWRTYWDRDAGPMGEEAREGMAEDRDAAMRAAIEADDALRETERAEAETMDAWVADTEKGPPR